MKKLAGLSITLAILAVIVGVIVFYPRTTEKPVQSAVNGVQTQEPLNADKIFELVNQERAKAGVPPLIRDSRLDASAQFKADDMVARNYFDHNDPSNPTIMNGVQKAYELTEHKVCSYASENIVWIKYKTPQEDNQEAVDWWMNSKAHHDAMLDAKYTLTGLAVKDGKIVQHFCQQ
jgi:uncharacterized protein YkwD